VSVTHRGPTGVAPPPPSDLAAPDLPIASLQVVATFTRVHRVGRAAVHFSPGQDRPPFGRFGSGTGRFGVLYVALSFEGAFAETILHNTVRQPIGLHAIIDRAVTTLVANRAIRLVDLCGPGLARLGLDAAIFSGPYEPCGLWADALHGHPDRPDGILYPSRHDPSEICAAVFERDDLSFVPAAEAVPLGSRLTEVNRLMTRYGKALEPL
jgi:hypothetical protein